MGVLFCFVLFLEGEEGSKVLSRKKKKEWREFIKSTRLSISLQET